MGWPAGIAAGLMEQLWVDTMPEAAQGTIETDVVSSSDNLCAATITITGDGSSQTENPILNALFDAYMRRNFSVLQIGEQ